MTPPVKPEQPWQLQFPPDGWQKVLTQAMADLRKNPHDEEALQAIRDANEALSVYDQGEAAPPGERIRAGIEGGLAGLGQAAVDVPRGIAQTVRHPIQTLMNIREVPRQIGAGLTSNDPEQVARSVGNIGSFALPFAKTSKAPGAATVGEIAMRAVAKPAQAVGAILERPILKNQLLRAQLERATRGPRATDVPIRGDVSAGAPKVPSTETPPVTAKPRLPEIQPTEPMDSPTYQRRGGYDQQIVAQALERATRKGARGQGEIVPAGPTQKAGPPTRMRSLRSKGEPSPMGRARQQLARLSDAELQQARDVAADNPQLLRLVEREIAKRATP